MLDTRPILMVNGLLLTILGFSMLLPAAVDLWYDNPDWQYFFMSFCTTTFIGVSLYLTNRDYSKELTLRQAFLFTASCWFFLPLFACLPFLFSELELSFTDAYFEAVSGLTTTGSTVIVGLDNAPPGILLWRGLLCALGGVGIVVLTIAVLPALRIGGMQLFRMESSESEKILPKVTQIASTIAIVYCILAFFCAIFFWIAGMKGFDALIHAFAVVSTAGFAGYDSSFGYFKSPAIELTATLFMILGSLPLLLYFRIISSGPTPIINNPQVRGFLGVIAVATFLLTLWLIHTNKYEPVVALRHALFAVVSVISTSGFATEDYNKWGSFAIMLFFFLIFVGGCTGSTTGGIKIFRFQVLYESARVHMRQLLQPHGVFLPSYNGKPIGEHIIGSVMNFFILFGATFFILSCTMSAFGPDFLTSLSGVAQAMANVGPGLGDIIGPSGNFSTLPDGAKWVLSLAMIIGRLELLTVLVILTPYFWRD